MGEVLVNTKIKKRKKNKGKEKGSNIPKSCLESSPGVATAENASSEHNEEHKHTSHQHRQKWDPNKKINVSLFWYRSKSSETMRQEGDGRERDGYKTAASDPMFWS
ncbi:hypothetical protein J6590_005622 [Homalodisca vitripennis]|nr:hypothetical protein J6590_005622 [Homalodisca vitripennis]